MAQSKGDRMRTVWRTRRPERMGGSHKEPASARRERGNLPWTPVTVGVGCTWPRRTLHLAWSALAAHRILCPNRLLS